MGAFAAVVVVENYALRSSVVGERERRPPDDDVEPSTTVERLARDCGGDERFVGGCLLGREEVPG